MRPFLYSALLATAIPALAQDKITYQDHVRPVFENRCLNCHNPDKKKGGLDLSTYATTLSGGSGGISVDPGDLNSALLKCVKFEKEPNMPPKSDKIPAPEIDLIAKWIEGGLLESSTSSAKIRKKQNFDMVVTGNALGKPEGPPPMPEQLLLDPVIESPRANSITSLAISPWAPLVAVAGTRQVLLYHSENGSLLGVLPYPEGSPECVGFSRNGSIVYAGGGKSGKKGFVTLWEVKTGKRVATVGDEYDSVLACDITPDHKLVALGGGGRKVRIYDTATARCVTTIKKHTDYILCCSFSPDGVLLASGDRNGGLYVWETSTGNEFYNLKGHEKAVRAVSWRPDSNVVASASEDGTVRWWEIQGGTMIKNFPAHGGAGVLSIRYGADASLITGGRDGKVRLFAPDGNQKRELVPANGAMVLQAALTPDGTHFITGSFNGEVKIWDSVKEPAEVPPVSIIANPPSIATRLTALEADLATKQNGVTAAQAAAVEKEKAVAAAQAEVTSVQQQIAGLKAEQQKAGALKEQIQAALTKVQAAKAKFAADLAEAQTQLTALQNPPAPAPAAPPQGATEPITAALQQAAQAEAAAAEISKALAEARIKDLTEILAKHDTEIAQLTARLPETDKNMADMGAKVVEMETAMPVKVQAIEAAQKLYAEAKSVVDAAGAAVAGVQQSVNQWLAARANKTVILTRTEIETLKDSVEGLKAEIPSLEAEVKAITEAKPAAEAKVAAETKTITDAKAATPPPAPEEIAKLDARLAALAQDVPKLDKKLEAASKRLAEARQELPPTEAKLAEKQQAADAAVQAYQALLPKQG